MFCGEIAQLVEHSTENRGVPGSSPGLAIRFCLLLGGFWIEQVGSSSRRFGPDVSWHLSQAWKHRGLEPADYLRSGYALKLGLGERGKLDQLGLAL
jgi:hypothetical protein